jgi:hypothetical protein
MSIEMRDSQNPETTERTDLSNCTVVTEVTVDMILNELANGVNKTQMQKKFAYRDENGTVRPFEKWMIDQIFKDPALRGKKPARKKVLPFVFKGSTTTAAPITPEPINNVPVTTTTMTAQSNGYVEINVEDNEENNNQYNFN